MATNFYLKAKQPRIVEVYDEHHIAKTSMGWKPLFDIESGCNSVADIKLKFDSGNWDIIDEYGSSYTWEQFEERVLGHCPEGMSHGEFVSHIDQRGFEFSKGGFC